MKRKKLPSHCDLYRAILGSSKLIIIPNLFTNYRCSIDKNQLNGYPNKVPIHFQVFQAEKAVTLQVKDMECRVLLKINYTRAQIN